MKKIIVLTSLLMTACTQLYFTQAYSPPELLPQSATKSFGHPKDEVFMAATRALVADGYKITRSDTVVGIISTAPRDLRLTPAQADCGSLSGKMLLLDNKTATKIAMNVMIGFHKLEVKSTIAGVYKPANEAVTLSCMSKGVLEQEMVQKIKAQIR
jgi:hypothetical protein